MEWCALPGLARRDVANADAMIIIMVSAAGRVCSGRCRDPLLQRGDGMRSPNELGDRRDSELRDSLRLLPAVDSALARAY